jgi:lysophospholipase L1-like esterase
VAELVLRMMGYGRLEIYVPDPQLYWRLKPNQDCFTKIGHKPVHINSKGTRGPEFVLPKPANLLRVLSVGDSVTFGWGLSDEETYSRLLQGKLQADARHFTQVEVINAGVNAWSYPQMTTFFEEIGTQFKPDCVILAGANLWTQFSKGNDPEFVKKFMNRVRLKNFLRRFALYHYVIEVQLEGFYQAQRAKFIPVDPKQDKLFAEQQKSDPDRFFREAIKEFCEIALTNKIQPVLLHIPRLTDLEAGTEDNVLKSKRQISESLHVPLVDCSARLRPKGKMLYLEADPVHLTAEGNEIVAQCLEATLKTMIKL